MNDDAAHLRTELEIDRIRAEVAHEFNVPPEQIESRVRDEFERRSQYPVQDFVPVFVQRTLRRRLRDSRLG